KPELESKSSMVANDAAGHNSVQHYATGQRVQDLVCGMSVDPRKAAGSFYYKGQTFFFCSLGCREEFKADPKRYLNPAAAAPIGIQRVHQKPLAIARGSDYTCPMHPAIVRDAPG